MKKVVMIIVLTIALLGSSLVTSANGLDYIVVPELPHNQSKGITNYISIDSPSDINQELKFHLINKTDREININAVPMNAFTSPNGSIQYSTKGKEQYSSLLDNKYSMSGNLEVPKEIILKPKETKEVIVNLNASKVDGTVLGAVGFSEHEEDVETDSSGITNVVTNIVGVQANFSEVEESALEVGDPYIEPLPAMYFIRLPIKHDTAKIVKGVSLEYIVKDKDGLELFQSSDKAYNFAPKTDVEIGLPWSYEKIEKESKYTIEGKFTIDGKTEEFTREFEFNPDRNKGKDSGDGFFGVPSLDDGNKLWIWVLIGVLSLLTLAIIILIIVLVRKRKKEDEDKTKRIEEEQEGA